MTNSIDGKYMLRYALLPMNFLIYFND